MSVEPELREAIEKLKTGDQDAFNIFYTHTYQFVYARAKFTVRDEHEAQDLMQEVYLAAYRNIGSLKNTDSIYSWLGGITLRQGMKLVNRKKRNILLSEDQESVFEDLPDESRGTEERIARAEEVQIMKDCICELSEEQRAVVLAYYYDEMKVEEDAWNVRRQYFRTARNTGWDMRQKEEKNLKKSPEPRKRITGKWIENIS